MPRFVEGEPRNQATLFPERIEDYIDEENPVRFIDYFVDGLDLEQLGFHGVNPKATGRPAYHPATMLKLYIYGYLNQVQTTRRLERESGRNIELMWLLGRLRPDFKTISNFRRSNGKAIRKVCAEFVGLCRKLDLFSQALVAIDGSKFKASNNRDKNFTPAKIKRRMEEIEKSIARYLSRLDRVDNEEPTAEAQSGKLADKIASLNAEVKRLKALEPEVLSAPDKQLSMTDPDARSMRTRGTGIVGYNVQTAVDAEHHLIVTHEVTQQNNDRDFLTSMASKAQDAMGVEELEVVADRGYYKSQEIKASEDVGVTPYVPKSHTSNNKAHGLFDRSRFRYQPETDTYQCPAGERLPKRTTTTDNGKTMYRYWSSNCGRCRLKSQCTTGKERRVSRWEHEAVLDRTEQRIVRDPQKMNIRRETVEHPFGTLKYWMGATHFQMTTLKHVKTEMSLHVLAYNIKRVMNILGVESLIEALRALLRSIIRLLKPTYPVPGLC
jgi:transposase